MSQDVLTINTSIGLSNTAEDSLNAMKTLAADFDAAETTAFNVVLPNVEKLVRKGLIGGGAAIWGRQALNGYITHPSMTFADILSTDQFARLARRFMSGTVTTTVVLAPVGQTPGVYDHVIELLPEDSDPQLLSSSIAFKAGGLDFILAGMVGNTLSVNYADGAAATYSLENVGTGKFDFMSAQTPALVLPKATAQNYMGNTGAHVKVTMNDGSLFDLSSLGLLAAYSLSASNDVQTSNRRSGDMERVAGNLESGVYVSRLTRGNNVTFQIGSTIYVDNGKRAYLDHLNNVDVTDLSFKNLGKIITGTYRYEVEFIVPKATMLSSQSQDRQGKIILECGFEPLLTGTEVGGWKLRIRNDKPTLA